MRPAARPAAAHGEEADVRRRAPQPTPECRSATLPDLPRAPYRPARATTTAAGPRSGRKRLRACPAVAVVTPRLSQVTGALRARDRVPPMHPTAIAPLTADAVALDRRRRAARARRMLALRTAHDHRRTARQPAAQTHVAATP